MNASSTDHPRVWLTAVPLDIFNQLGRLDIQKLVSSSLFSHHLRFSAITSLGDILTLHTLIELLKAELKLSTCIREVRLIDA